VAHFVHFWSNLGKWSPSALLATHHKTFHFKASESDTKHKEMKAALVCDKLKK